VLPARCVGGVQSWWQEMMDTVLPPPPPPPSKLARKEKQAHKDAKVARSPSRHAKRPGRLA